MSDELRNFGLADPRLTALPFAEVDSPEWLEMRRKGIGGSDAGAIMGLNKYSTPLKVYKDKVLDIKDDLSDNPNVRRGKDLEEVILTKYVMPKLESEEGMFVAKPDFMIVNSDVPFYRANLDGIAMKAGKAELVVEIKCVSEFGQSNWDGPDYLGVPPYYYAQVQCYMRVTGLRKALICALYDKEWEMHYFEIPYDPEFCSRMDDACSRFYERNMLMEIPPAPSYTKDDAGDVKHAILHRDIGISTGKPVEESPEMTKLCEEYADLKRQAKAISDRTAAISDELLGLYREGKAPGAGHSVTFSTVTSKRFNSAKFKKDNPTMYEQYCEDSESSRLTVK